MTKGNDFCTDMEQNLQTAELPGRLHVLVDYALKLTKSPASVSETDIMVLRVAGFSDQAIHDAIAIIAYFNFVNRIASGLGVQLEESKEV